MGERKSHITVMTAEREVVEDLKIENSPEGFRRIFRKYKRDVVAACETSSNAFWVADTLVPLVEEILVGHPTKIRWIAEARIKTDKIDARILAELGRADLFLSITIPPRRVRDRRELARGLIRIRRPATRLRDQVHGLLGRRSEVKGAKLEELVGDAKLVAAASIAAKALKEEEKGLEAAMENELEGETEILDAVKLLDSIPGIGYFSAVLFVLELWDITRFRDEKHLASYIGFVPGTPQTGETLWQGRMTKTGNRLVRWVLAQDAWIAAIHHEFFGRLYERHRKKKGGSRAIVPVARALLRTIHRVWSQRKSYQELYEKKALVG